MELPLEFEEVEKPKPKRQKKKKQELSLEFIQSKSFDFLKSEIESLNSFAMKDGYLTSGFSGDVLLFCQMLGNLSSAASYKVLDLDTKFIVFSASIIEQLKSSNKSAEIIALEKKLHKQWGHFKNCWYITESDLLLYLLNRFEKVDDQISLELLKSYTNGIRRIGF